MKQQSNSQHTHCSNNTHHKLHLMALITDQPVAYDDMVSTEIHSLKDEEYLTLFYGEVLYIIVIVITMA